MIYRTLTTAAAGAPTLFNGRYAQEQVVPMKISLCTIFIIFITLLGGCTDYEYDYIQSQEDPSNVITRIKHRGRTYFVYGKYTDRKVPADNYLLIGSEKQRSEYQLFLYWQGDTAHIEALQGGVYSPVNLPDKFIFLEAESNEIDRFVKLGLDTTGRYTYLCDCDLPAPKPDPLPANYGKPLREQLKDFEPASN